jgi:nitrogen regulatory protein PII
VRKIEAIIRPSQLDRVKESLGLIGVRGMTATEVRGFGRQRGHTERYRGAEYSIELLPKIKLEIAVEDGFADAVVRRLVQVARTGRIGDGKVLVLPLEDAIRIRTGERGRDAL